MAEKDSTLELSVKSHPNRPIENLDTYAEMSAQLKDGERLQMFGIDSSGKNITATIDIRTQKEWDSFKNPEFYKRYSWQAFAATNIPNKLLPEALR